MKNKRIIPIVLSIILVAVTSSACKPSKQAKGNETSQKSIFSSMANENSQENNGDFSQLIEGKNSGEEAKKSTSDNSVNTSKEDKDSNTNIGENEIHDSKNNGSEDTNQGNASSSTVSEDKALQSDSKVEVTEDTNFGFGSLF